MTHEAPLDLPVAVHVDKALIENAQQTPAEPLPLSQIDAEHARALEAAFLAAQDKENKEVEGLLALWAGTAILRDVAIDTFSEPVTEFMPERQKRKDSEPEQ